jgi:hypothetical protein
MNRPHAFMPKAPSTAAQRQQSLHFQGQGDIWFRQHNYLQAYSRYKQAAGAATDLAAPHFRLAYALMALDKFDLAVPELAQGIRLDPQYPGSGESVEQVYGEENRLAAASLPRAAAAWVRQDIRSADRLFLLGALLKLSGDQARSKILLENAAEFGGGQAHVLAFLRAGEVPAEVAAASPAEEKPPVPEAVEKMLKDDHEWLPARPLADARKRAAKGAQLPGPAVPQHPGTDRVAPRPKVVPPEPVEAAEPAEIIQAGAKQSIPIEPGYIPIPKKGSSEKPPEVVPAAEPPTPAEPTPAVEAPAATPASDGESGPIIPVPGAGQSS